MLKTWIKDAEIKNVGAYFAVSDAKAELSPWDSRLHVSSRGYMLGYTDGMITCSTLHRREAPAGQRIFPLSVEGRRRNDENADRENRLRGRKNA